MPMVDFVCVHGHRFEAFFHPSAAKTVEQYPCPCGSLGYRSQTIVHAPAIVWTGPVGQRYRDRGCAGYHDPDGQWAYTRKGPDGKPCAPKAVRLNTWQDVKSYAKSEGCHDPRDLPKTMEVGADGKSVSTRGFAGQEI